MTQSVQSLLDTFDRLPEAEKSEAFAAILRRVRSLAFEHPADSELVLNAEQIFLDLDRREAADGHA